MLPDCQFQLGGYRSENPQLSWAKSQDYFGFYQATEGPATDIIADPSVRAI